MSAVANSTATPPPWLGQLKSQGHCVLRSFASPSLCERLKADIFQWREEQAPLRDPAYRADWGAHHFVDRPSARELLEGDALEEMGSAFFQSKTRILHSIGASINPPAGQGAYAHGSAWHRDTLHHRGEQSEFAVLLIMLDPFTEANGATLVAPRTHLSEARPSDAELDALAEPAIGGRGDALLIYPDTLHRAGANSTDAFRVGLTLTLTRPYIKPLMDYARMLGLDRESELSPRLAQILGYNAKTPQSMAEWNAPSERRFYKKDQG